MRALLTVNANASGVGEPDDAFARASRLLQAAGAAVEGRVTASIDDFGALVAEAEGRRVVVLGGDGTLHAAVNLPPPLPEFALLPAGGANNIAASLGIPTELEAAAALAATGRARLIDLIEVHRGERRYVAVEGASVGVHAVARAQYRAANSTDVRAAVRAAWRAVRSFRGASIVLETDGVTHGARIEQLFVANLPLYGFGLHVAPHAQPDDGLLDVVVREWRGRADELRLFVRLRLDRAELPTWPAERIRIDTGRSPLICDSTNLGHGTAELAVLPRALALVAP